MKLTDVSYLEIATAGNSFTCTLPSVCIFYGFIGAFSRWTWVIIYQARVMRNDMYIIRLTLLQCARVCSPNNHKVKNMLAFFPPRHACEPNCLNQWRHWVKLIKLWSIHVWVAGKQFPKCGDRLFVSILFLGPIQKEQQEQRSSKYVNDSPVIYQMVNYDLFNYKFLRVSHLTRLRLLSHQVYFPQPLLAV